MVRVFTWFRDKVDVGFSFLYWFRPGGLERHFIAIPLGVSGRTHVFGWEKMTKWTVYWIRNIVPRINPRVIRLLRSIVARASSVQIINQVKHGKYVFHAWDDLEFLLVRALQRTAWHTNQWREPCFEIWSDIFWKFKTASRWAEVWRTKASLHNINIFMVKVTINPSHPDMRSIFRFCDRYKYYSPDLTFRTSARTIRDPRLLTPCPTRLRSSRSHYAFYSCTRSYGRRPLQKTTRIPLGSNASCILYGFCDFKSTAYTCFTNYSLFQWKVRSAMYIQYILYVCVNIHGDLFQHKNNYFLNISSPPPINFLYLRTCIAYSSPHAAHDVVGRSWKFLDISKCVMIRHTRFLRRLCCVWKGTVSHTIHSTICL
jgi:hypothetical protein